MARETRPVNQPQDITKVGFRWLGPYLEQGCHERLLEQAARAGMNYNEFARQKLSESLEDDRLDHLAALVQQVHAKTRDLEQSVDQIRRQHKKAVMAILIHVCDMSPQQAQQLLGGDPPD